MHNFKQILTSNQRPGVFSIPALGHPGENLDQLLLSLDSLWMASEVESLPKYLLRLKRASISLDQHFVQWQGSRVVEFKSTTIGTIDQSNTKLAAWCRLLARKKSTRTLTCMSPVYGTFSELLDS
jgi:hypothetical protein